MRTQAAIAATKKATLVADCEAELDKASGLGAAARACAAGSCRLQTGF